jgi:hypothetical protein
MSNTVKAVILQEGEPRFLKVGPSWPRRMSPKRAINFCIFAVLLVASSCTKHSPFVEPELPECDCRFPNTGEFGVLVEQDGDIECVIKPCRSTLGVTFLSKWHWNDDAVSRSLAQTGPKR